MGLLASSSMVFLFLFIMWSSAGAQMPDSSVDQARSLDALLQDFAFKALDNPRTGIPYDGKVPSNFSGITISALRLKNGSFRRRGFQNYKEFEFPTGVMVQPYMKRIVFVYQDLGNWSSIYYPLPGYVYLSPVLGLLAYDGSNLSSTNLLELDITSNQPILIRFSELISLPPTARCITFDLHGFLIFSHVHGNICSTVQQGHFAIVFESNPPVLPPPSSPPSPRPSSLLGRWKIYGYVSSGVMPLLLIIIMLLVWFQRHKKNVAEKEALQDFEVPENIRPKRVSRLSRAKAWTGKCCLKYCPSCVKYCPSCMMSAEGNEGRREGEAPQGRQ